MSKPFWHKDAFGFWFLACIQLSASAGWAMVHYQLLQ